MNFKRLLGGLLLGAFSLLLAYSSIKPFVRAIEQKSWEKIECTIESAALDGRAPDGLRVAYWYEIGGVRHKGDVWALPSPVVTSGRDLQARVNRYQPNTTVPCWLSPERMDLIVLERESLWVGAVLLIPIAGLIGSFFLLKYSARRSKQSTASQLRSSTTSFVKSSDSSMMVYGFFSIFILVGLGLTYLFFFRHLIAVWEARSWSSATCTILASEVQSHTSHDSKTGRSSTSYSISVSYVFEHNGKRYTGDAYSVGSPDFSDSDTAHRNIADIPKGSTVPCFFDSGDPTRSAIRRDLDSITWLGLLPLIFTAAGCMGAVFVYQQNQGTAKQRSNTGKKIRRAQNRLLGLIGLILATIVWNGIVGVGTYAFMSSGSEKWFIGIFIVPFALIGILLIAAIPLGFLQLFNPTVNFELPKDSLRFGENCFFGWTLNGSPRRIKKFSLRISLVPPTTQGTVGSSSSDLNYDDGTDDNMGDVDATNDNRENSSTAQTAPTRTQASQPGAVFFEKEIFQTSAPERMTKGSVSCRLPERSEISRIDAHTGVRWKLTAHMEIAWYPDSQEVIEFDVEESDSF